MNSSKLQKIYMEMENLHEGFLNIIHGGSYYDPANIKRSMHDDKLSGKEAEYIGNFIRTGFTYALTNDYVTKNIHNLVEQGRPSPRIIEEILKEIAYDFFTEGENPDGTIKTNMIVDTPDVSTYSANLILKLLNTLRTDKRNTLKEEYDHVEFKGQIYAILIDSYDPETDSYPSEKKVTTDLIKKVLDGLFYEVLLYIRLAPLATDTMTTPEAFPQAIVEERAKIADSEIYREKLKGKLGLKRFIIEVHRYAKNLLINTINKQEL